MGEGIGGGGERGRENIRQQRNHCATSNPTPIVAGVGNRLVIVRLEDG